jgi:hypothetical protein
MEESNAFGCSSISALQVVCCCEKSKFVNVQRLGVASSESIHVPCCLVISLLNHCPPKESESLGSVHCPWFDPKFESLPGPKAVLVIATVVSFPSQSRRIGPDLYNSHVTIAGDTQQSGKGIPIHVF